MTEPTLYQWINSTTPPAGWVVGSLALEDDDGVPGWLVPVERCEHGNIDPHVIGYHDYHDDDGYAIPKMCPGARIGGDDG